MDKCAVTTIGGLCKRCYSCVRNCPVKAIKVENGQSMVMSELCISCGHCVEVCSQKAKRIASSSQTVLEMLKRNKVFACLAPSFITYYNRIAPGQVVSAVKKLGFDEVWEVAYGARLVAQEYEKSILTAKDKKHCIATPCPAVVNLVEKFHPDLIKFLVPVVSPMIAIGRYIKLFYGVESKVVFIGPCVAKKEEMNDPMVQGAVDAVLTFPELDKLLHDAKVKPGEVVPEDWSSPPAGLARLFPVTGGLLRTASHKIDPLNGEVVTVEGREDCLSFLDSLARGEVSVKFVDMLFCKGCINGPMLKSDEGSLRRRQLVAVYAGENLSTGESQVQIPAGLELSRPFTKLGNKLPHPTEAQIETILADLGKFSPVDQLNCGACGYDTCRSKAIAIFQGIAEKSMCLPFLVANLESANIHLREQLKDYYLGMQNMLGSTPSMLAVYRIIEKVAPTDSTVLIRGESGTGKDLVAQALHQKSRRSGNKLISINCAALPENLLESELFGHAKGAFTGAVSEKKGLFEEANGGTLFLDEIGDLSPQLQAKLLRLLQQGEFFRIGETTPRKCDVRIIAATNQNLEKLIEETKFREDLYYRLNVVTINLPPLRDRKDDIPVLSKYFLDRFCKKHGKKIAFINHEAAMHLMAANWPGNIRELENAIERAVILCEGVEIKPEDLPPLLEKEYRHREDEINLNYKEATEEYKKKLVQEALKQASGVQARAAELMGIGRSTLNELIKRLNIEQ